MFVSEGSKGVKTTTLSFKLNQSQLADILTKGLLYPQWQACVEGILSKKVNST